MKRAWISLAAVLLLLSSAALAQSAPPSADTYSNAAAGDAGINYGSAVLLVVQTGGNNAYIQFNLGDLPTGSTVSKATLRLFVNALVTSGSFDVYQLNKSWSESTLTHNNAPALGVSATGGHPVAVSKVNQFVLVDITSLVQGWQNGTIANNGIALATTTSKGSFSFDSKESIFTSHQPELEIVLNAPAGAPGPQGPQGPQGLTGNTGATGPTGPIGLTGNTGATGPQGSQGIQGPTGNTGATGPIGPVGAQGPAGNNGAPGTNGTGFNFTGAFNPSSSYNAYDVVTYQGSTYDANTAIASNAGTPDINPQWVLMAAAGAAGTPGANGAPGAPGSTGAQGSQGPQGNPGPQGAAGTNGLNGTNGINGTNGADGAQGPAGPQGASGDVNARMIFPSFYPGGLTGSWIGGQFTLDQAITVLRIAVVAKTPTQSTCPAAVFRLSNGTKGQDLVLPPGQNWSDTGAMVMTFNAGDVLQSSLRTGSVCPGPVGANYTGADANLLVEYKMQAAGDTDACSGTSCSGFCTTFTADPSNCGGCGTACASGQACVSGACNGSSCGAGQTNCNGLCVNEQTDPNNCGACGSLCKQGTFCDSGKCAPPSPNGAACISASQCLSGNCSGGVCAPPSCPAGQASCDGYTCTTLQTDPKNCGTCGLVCVSGVCAAGSCAASCSAGQTLCSGACVNTQTDTKNCGGCGLVCSVNNATPACQSGACAIQSCNPGFQDCNRNPADGCEINTNSDVNNCGACGNVCSPGQSCNAGVCTTLTCTAIDQCHVAGTRDPVTGVCSNPAAPDGTACNDGNLCTQGDSCSAGVCVGQPVVCSAGSCNPATGQCS
jgi:hypothetical protein